jgi:membrane fusion protein (multidrug efflux system)
MVEPRVLVAERAIGDRWLVTSGLQAGDRLVVEGLNKIGPGMPVKPTEITLKGDAPPAAAGSAAAPAAGSAAAPAAKPVDEKAGDASTKQAAEKP